MKERENVDFIHIVRADLGVLNIKDSSTYNDRHVNLTGEEEIPIREFRVFQSNQYVSVCLSVLNLSKSHMNCADYSHRINRSQSLKEQPCRVLLEYSPEGLLWRALC